MSQKARNSSSSGSMTVAGARTIIESIWIERQMRLDQSRRWLDELLRLEDERLIGTARKRVADLKEEVDALRMAMDSLYREILR